MNTAEVCCRSEPDDWNGQAVKVLTKAALVVAEPAEYSSGTLRGRITPLARSLAEKPVGDWPTRREEIR